MAKRTAVVEAKIEKSGEHLLRNLWEGLNKRPRPEQVAATIKTLLGSSLSETQAKILNKAARYGADSESSMSDDFAHPDDMREQLMVAADLFPILKTPADPSDVDGITNFLKVANILIGKKVGENSFKKDRLDRKERKKQDLDISKRQYNKRFRFLVRCEDKLRRLGVEIKKRFLTLASKSRLASTITVEEMRDVDTASFIAYYTARCSLRSVFAVAHQERPYDEIADMLLKRCLKRKQMKTLSNPNWFAIAKVHPVQEVLAKLSDKQKGELLGRYFSIIEDLANLLKDIWEKSDINRKTMIVKRGNDSTTWNVMAGAWNKSRDAWINLLYAMNMENGVDEFLPGKVLRLMAGDVAAMHQHHGSGLEPDTQVWNELPLPWEVVSGEKSCTKAIVVKACEKAKIDPEKKGWVFPRPKTVAAYSPTPELVHGVIVSNPAMALIFRKAGVFSGKKNKLADLDWAEIEAVQEARKDAHDKFLKQQEKAQTHRREKMEVARR